MNDYLRILFMQLSIIMQHNMQPKLTKLGYQCCSVQGNIEKNSN